MIGVLLEGGNIFKDQGHPLTQRINRADIEPTVKWLEKITGLDFTSDRDEEGAPARWLGSTGRKDSSGDLDLQVDANQVTKAQLIGQLTRWCESQGIPQADIMNAGQKKTNGWIKDAGVQVHFRTPIRGNAKSGFVQTDFMFAQKPQWHQFVLSGNTLRNILINSIAKSLGWKLNQHDGIFDRASNKFITDDPDRIAKLLLNPNASRKDLKSVESIMRMLKMDPRREEKIADFRAHMAREGLPFDETLGENEINFLARLRDRIVNQGMQPLVETVDIVEAAGAVAPVGGRAKGIEHLEDLVFRQGSRGVKNALEIVKHISENSRMATVKWDGKPAVIFGRKPSTGEFVLTDGSGFEAKTYDGLFTSPASIRQDMARRDANAQAKGNQATRVETLLPIYEKLWPMLEQALPTNFRGYVKGDLLYMTTPPLVAGNYVFQPNTVEYRIPANSKLGERIGTSTVGIAMHTMYADAGDPQQPLSRVRFNAVPGLLLIEPIAASTVKLNEKLIKEIRSVLRARGTAIDTLFNPTELKAMQITDLAKLCVDFINHKIGTGNFDNLLPEFGQWLKTRVTPRKFNNIIEYLQSPRSNTEGMAAAFTLFMLLHDLKMDLQTQLDLQVPGNEGWVFATPAGYAKAVNRFDFTVRNRARNNP
jgi:hypothetical protein